MNDLYARKLSQSTMFHHAMRTVPTLWAATKVTKEPLDGAFVREEFMRVNGHRTMPLLVGEIAQHKMQNHHFTHLSETHSWTDSHRSFAVRNQTVLTQRFAELGRMYDNIQNVRTQASPQAAFLEHIARAEGVSTHEESHHGEDEEEEA